MAWRPTSWLPFSQKQTSKQTKDRFLFFCFFYLQILKIAKKRENLLGKNTFHTKKSTFLFPKFSLKISQSNENSPQKTMRALRQGQSQWLQFVISL
jgi:hypothetical protein